MISRRFIRRGILLTIQLVILVLLMFLMVFFSWEFFTRYNLPYNEMGRYFDEENSVVIHEQTLPFFGFLALLFLVLSVVSAFWIFKTIKKFRKQQT